ncbi:MAG: general stress protein CsbD [Bacteroidales bacterium]
MNLSQSKNNEAFKITGNWDAKSKLLQGRFSQLTDADLKFETGKEDELLGRVERRLNKKREEVITMIKNVQSERI